MIEEILVPKSLLEKEKRILNDLVRQGEDFYRKLCGRG